MRKYYRKQHYSKHRRYKPKGGKAKPFGGRQHRAVIKKFKFFLLILGLIILFLFVLRYLKGAANG